ncbi:MAG TPA: Fur family transcriptional regulator [Candidatus Limnocylindria bacterium]|nr:Fur family transcriptional regulator [Candidatus Limnocylindria bacterium]
MRNESSPVADRLKHAGERVTNQRLVIAAELGRASRQVTADELYARLQSSHPGIGRATVFRTLERLVDAGVARRLEREGHVYGYVTCEPEHHHHLACTRCGRVEEINESYITPLATRIKRERGFQVDDARLDFYGRCASCLAAEGSG